MGHRQDTNKYAAHRTATLLQRRIGSFVLVFSVFMIALSMLFSALQAREARCQERAHQIEFDLIVSADATRGDVVNALQTILEARHCFLDFSPQNDDVASVVQLDVLDTPANFIAERGFRLVRRYAGTSYYFQLSAIFDRLCGTYPPVSMEVLANVDYERVSYHIKGISLTNRTVKYLQQSSLLTKDMNRVTTVTQLQSLFPGLQQFGLSTARLAPLHSRNYTVEGVSQVYFEGTPIDIHVMIQHWGSDHGTAGFWRVVMSTPNIMAEQDLISLESSVRQGFALRHLLCNATSENCADQVDMYLR
ncbi:hypothetical protein LSCM1_02418 [Leishmania martiniquensis]|uniref:Uncharacterized protein n=1 Tax=Leishmania martiniquensis TaxID=1580590 RepID=A0A836GR47_9TRYP|nr:hypothetical protein LSCM1_02418 [Leishmania martiniquensis]